MRTYLYLGSAVILLAGLSSSIVIYRAAMSDASSNARYEFSGGFVYQGTGGYTKKYVHDLQLYGGNAAVLADEFMHWFTGLWQGESLAYIVGFVAVALSLVLFFIARRASSDIASGPPDVSRRDGKE